MGTISLEKSQQMYWLGRYTERVFTTLRTYLLYYDRMLDMGGDLYQNYCQALGIPDVYGTREVFIHDYLFDAANSASIHSSLQRAFDNGVVIRDEISTDTLSYIQLCLNILEQAEQAEELVLELQKIIDYLYAFWGSLDDCVASQRCRNILKAGRYHERLDLYLRLSYSVEEIEKEYNKLKHRLMASGMQYRQDLLEQIGQIIAKPDEIAENRSLLLSCLVQLTQV